MVDLDYMDDIPEEEQPSPPSDRAHGADRAETSFERGEALYLAGKFEGALEAHQRATQLAPRFYKAHAATMDALLALERVEDAENMGEELLKQFNRNTDLGTARAHAYLHRYGLLAGAPALQESADFNYQLAVQFCEIATDITPGSSHAWLRKGEVAVAKKEKFSLATGRKHFERAGAGMPSWEFETKVGMILYEWEWFGEAVKQLEKAADISGERACIYFWLGKALLACDKRGEAKECLQKALRIDSAYAEAEAALDECSPQSKAIGAIKSALGWGRRK